MTKYVRVDRMTKPDVDLDELKAAITVFVAGIRSHHPTALVHIISTPS